jgi:hypothetical protein
VRLESSRVAVPVAVRTRGGTAFVAVLDRWQAVYLRILGRADSI